MSSNYQQQTEEELREQLRGRDLTTGGSKRKLVARLEADDEEGDEGGDGADEERHENDDEAASDGPRPALMALAAKAQLGALIGQPIEAMVGLDRVEDRWCVTFDVLELEKVPRTCDILATYLVELDDDGELRGYRRLRRYVRGQADLGAYQ